MTVLLTLEQTRSVNHLSISDGGLPKLGSSSLPHVQMFQGQYSTFTFKKEIEGKEVCSLNRLKNNEVLEDFVRYTNTRI